MTGAGQYTLRRHLGGSAVLLAANLVGGLAQYLFQIRGAASLTDAEYGALNGWMAYVSIALSLGSVAQFLSNFVPLSGGALRRAGALSILLAALSLGPAVLRDDLVDHRWLIGLATVALGITWQFLLGQLQGRTWFGWMALSMFSVGIAKLGSSYLPAIGVRKFYLAFPISLGVACVGQGLLFLLHQSTEDESVQRVSSEPRVFRKNLAATAVLAMATAWIPQLDILNVRLLQSDVIFGQFARASLFSKALFFGALTLLQVTLPYHIRFRRNETDAAAHRRVRLLEDIGLLLGVVASFGAAFIAPFVTRRVFGIPLEPGQQLWILLSCLCLTALYGHLQRIQLYCALGEWKAAGVRVLPLGFIMLEFYVVRPASVSTYLSLALAQYVLLGLVDALARRRTAKVYSPGT